MNHWKLTAIVAGALTVAACAPAPTEAPAAKADDPSVVTSLREKYEAAENSNTPAPILELWAEDGIIMPPNRPPLEGKAAIENNYKEQFAMGKTDLKISSAEAVASGDWAFERGSYTLKITPPDAPAPLLDDEGKYIVIARRQADSTWKVSRLMFSSNKPPAPMPPMASTAPAKKP